MNRVYESIDRLVDYAQKNLGLDPRNAVYARNAVFGILGLDSYPGDTGARAGDTCSPDAPLTEFVDACVAEGLYARADAENYTDAVMGALSLPPKDVEDGFYRVMSQAGPERATGWLYDYSVKSDYVKKSKLDANPRFDIDGLTVTINKAKPEFSDPKKAASGNSVKGGYPKCTICRENEGFAGRNKRTLRTVGIRLGGEDWFWQFSPYGYFYQHGIAVNCRHTPMHVDRSTFVRLMDFVDLFPHYFIGCNATLPRIGGSVLAHDHYQGGGEILPLHKAGEIAKLSSAEYPEAAIGVLDWPGTVVRVSSADREAVAELSERIRYGWTTYRNDELGIIPEDAEGVHSAVSPTVIKTSRGYEMNIILRNNITNAEYPDGVFHAHPEFHVIKKESIGLIEAQGLFILPGRLVEQLGALEKCIISGGPLPGELAAFDTVFEETKALCGDKPTAAKAREAMKAELGSICRRILGNTAVFKSPSLTVKFLKGLGFTCNDR